MRRWWAKLSGSPAYGSTTRQTGPPASRSSAAREIGSAEIIERATRSTLAKAEELGCKSLALVAFGTGVGGFPLDEAARIMVGVARSHQGEPERIVFAVHGDEAEQAFRAQLES